MRELTTGLLAGIFFAVVGFFSFGDVGKEPQQPAPVVIQHEACHIPGAMACVLYQAPAPGGSCPEGWRYEFITSADTVKEVCWHEPSGYSMTLQPGSSVGFVGLDTRNPDAVEVPCSLVSLWPGECSQ